MGQKYFEDFVLGEVFDIPSKTLTESHFVMFAAVTGDNHPIHYDREYCRARGFPERLAHGYLVTVQTVLGASSLSPALQKASWLFWNSHRAFSSQCLSATLRPNSPYRNSCHVVPLGS